MRCAVNFGGVLSPSKPADHVRYATPMHRTLHVAGWTTSTALGGWGASGFARAIRAAAAAAELNSLSLVDTRGTEVLTVRVELLDAVPRMQPQEVCRRIVKDRAVLLAAGGARCELSRLVLPHDATIEAGCGHTVRRDGMWSHAQGGTACEACLPVPNSVFAPFVARVFRITLTDAKRETTEYIKTASAVGVCDQIATAYCLCQLAQLAVQNCSSSTLHAIIYDAAAMSCKLIMGRFDVWCESSEMAASKLSNICTFCANVVDKEKCWRHPLKLFMCATCADNGTVLAGGDKGEGLPSLRTFDTYEIASFCTRAMKSITAHASDEAVSRLCAQHLRDIETVRPAR